MLVAGVDEELFVHLAAQAVFRQHAFDGPFDDRIRTTAQEVLGDLVLLSAGVAGEVDINFVFQFVTRKHNLVGVDDNDEVATVDVGSVVGFVLAPENCGNLGTHATDGLISTVHDVPVALNGSLVRVFGGEMQFAHFLYFLRDAIAIPMALIEWERKIRGFIVFVPRKNGVIF
jgi:hypothetical protein